MVEREPERRKGRRKEKKRKEKKDLGFYSMIVT
jgi:hypothetical protein